MQIENAITLLEIEIGAVQFTAMPQASGKIALRQPRVEDLGLEVINRIRVLGILGIKRGRSEYCKKADPDSYASSSASAAPKGLMRIFIPSGYYCS